MSLVHIGGQKPKPKEEATGRWTFEGRRDALLELYNKWSGCVRCGLHEKRNSIVFGNGNPEADLFFVGQAPGKEEDKEGEPFIGPAGQMFDLMLESAGIERKDVFTTNLVMCFPPNDRAPTKIEREACLERLYEQIYIVDPLMVILVGGVPMSALMGSLWKAVTDHHGKLGLLSVPGKIVTEVLYPAMPILHPSYILREDALGKDNEWPDGGPAHATIQDLAKAKKVARLLKTTYRIPKQ